MYSKYIKRIFDFMLSLLSLIVISPFLAILAIIVRLKLGSPILFSQERAGLSEEHFKMYKFRTMTDKRDEYGNLLPDGERLTNFGKKLRAASLDELPELFNILKGDMSIVGPRPLFVEYLPLYNEKQRHRHDVRPGLTGKAQVNGRNEISWEQKFNYDVEYIQELSFSNDIKILLLTVMKVLKREGINSETEATVETFKGTIETTKEEYQSVN